jgi:Tfp pilus assembly protein PilF
LQELGESEQAVAALRAAIRLRSDFTKAHFQLGEVRRMRQEWVEAEAEYRRAIKLKPSFDTAHNNLGLVLQAQGKMPEAVEAFGKAIAVKPDSAGPQYNLGNALWEQGKMAEAAAAYQKATELNPDYAEAHCNLGLARLTNGQFALALTSLRRGHNLGSRDPKWSYASAEWVQRCERMLRLQSRLPAYLSGSDLPADAADLIALADFCERNKRYTTAVRFYADAFSKQASLERNLQAGHRYEAACAAALASCGKDKDAGKLSEPRCAQLRQQALAWLRADLDAWHRLLEKGPAQNRPAIVQRMQHWLQDPDFAGVRGEQALAGLPAAERGDWRQLWQRIEALRQHAASAHP